MSLVKLIVSIVLSLIWISDSIIINFVQLLLYTFLRPCNPRLYRKLNYYLIYTSWSQVVALAQYWSKCDLVLHFPDEKSRDSFGKEFNLTVMNHKYEIDWLFTWLVMDHFRNLGSSKSYAKKALKWVPIIGWSFHFGEFIFLERSWEKDSKIMEKCLNNLKEYEEEICLLLFAEGTRFTKSKHEQSCKFANEKGIKPLKYHLIPRTRGFTYTVNHLKDSVKSIFNAQLEFDVNGNKPTFTNILKGKPVTGHLYLQRIAIEDVPTGSDEELNKFLFEIYDEKDKLAEEFVQTNTFKTKYIKKITPRLTPLINMIAWFIIMISLFYSTFYLLIAFKFYTLLTWIIVVFALIGVTALVMLVRSTKAVRGSTYGATSSKKETDDKKAS